MISRRAGQCGSGRNRNHHQRSVPKRRLLGEAIFAHQPLRAQYQVGRLHSVSRKWCGLAGGNRYRAGLRSRRLTCTGSLPAILSPTIKIGMLASIMPSVVAVTTGRMWTPMDALTLFGLSAVTAMLICYALEDRNRTFILAFAASCVLGSAYGFLQGAWPFGVLEAIWSLVAIRRWLRRGAAPF